MTTPFDTTRLDEECERIANEIQASRMFRYDPIFNHEVRDILLGKSHSDEWDDEQWRVFAIAVYDRCRRPKMVRA